MLLLATVGGQHDGLCLSRISSSLRILHILANKLGLCLCLCLSLPPSTPLSPLSAIMSLPLSLFPLSTNLCN